MKNKVFCPRCGKPMQAVARWAMGSDDIRKFHCEFYDYIYSWHCPECGHDTAEAITQDEACRLATEEVRNGQDKSEVSVNSDNNY